MLGSAFFVTILSAEDSLLRLLLRRGGVALRGQHAAGDPNRIP
jgi:hypothetical protein